MDCDYDDFPVMGNKRIKKMAWERATTLLT